MASPDRSSDQIYAITGDRIRASRKREKLTQSALAAAVGLTRTSIVMIENGKQRILLHTLYDVASALHISPADLLPDLNNLEGKPSADSFAPENHRAEAREFVRSVMTIATPIRK